MFAIMYDIGPKIPPSVRPTDVKTRRYQLYVDRDTTTRLQAIDIAEKMKRSHDEVVLRVGYKEIEGYVHVRAFLDDMKKRYEGDIADSNVNAGYMIFPKELRDNARRLMEEERFILD